MNPDSGIGLTVRMGLAIPPTSCSTATARADAEPAATEREQDSMVASIGPFWDANETWLALGIGLLLVGFPQAHGMILGALYLSVVAMLIGLMLRGAAYEFRIKAEGWHRELWNWLFWFGSFLASLAQGLMLGRYITGFEPGFGYLLFSLLVAAGGGG